MGSSEKLDPRVDLCLLSFAYLCLLSFAYLCHPNTNACPRLKIIILQAQTAVCTFCRNGTAVHKIPWDKKLSTILIIINNYTYIIAVNDREKRCAYYFILSK